MKGCFAVAVVLCLLSHSRAAVLNGVIHRVGARFGPSGCVSVTRSSEGSCVMTLDCQGLEISQTEFAFDCVGKTTVRHSFGVGGFEADEEFDTALKCDQCNAPSSVEAIAATTPVDKKKKEAAEQEAEEKSVAAKAAAEKNKKEAAEKQAAAKAEKEAAAKAEKEAAAKAEKEAAEKNKKEAAEKEAAPKAEKEAAEMNKTEVAEKEAAAKAEKEAEEAVAEAAEEKKKFEAAEKKAEEAAAKVTGATADAKPVVLNSKVKIGSQTHVKHVKHIKLSSKAKHGSNTHVPKESKGTKTIPAGKAVTSFKIWGSSAEEKTPTSKNLRSSPEVVRYGPNACIAVYKGADNHCRMSTSCSGVNMSNYEYGLVCVDKAGSPVKHLFGKDSFDPVESFDTLIQCNECLGLEDVPDGVALAGEVSALSKAISGLTAAMTNISMNVQRLNQEVLKRTTPSPTIAPATVIPVPTKLLHKSTHHRHSKKKKHLRHSHFRHHAYHVSRHAKESDDNEDGLDGYD